ncbi:DUF2213 domain-containing protein [Pelagerythrobacter marinus]|nr:DUF2213 domain-containing protein [Pelagerythrobacter marinus]
MKRALVHIRCNTGKVRRERRNGRDVIIVPSYTLPSGVVMNRVRYEHDEIEKAYKSFERTPAPLGHPTIEGAFVSAKDPEGLARGWVGSWNENVRRDGHRIAMDKVIDVEQAKQLDGGKTILAAIEGGEPIHSSTGLFCMLEPTTDDDEADFIARDIVGDHDAWLIGEEGAATPQQGVGILVNSQTGETEADIPVINCSLEDDIDRDIGWSIESMFRAVERKERLGLIEQAKNYITRLIQGDPTPEINRGDALTTNEDAMDKAQFDALSGEVKALSDTVAAIPETIATAVANAVKPLTDALEAQAKDAADKAEADRLELANRVVEAGLLEEAVAKEATAPVLNALLEKHKTPAAAYRVNRAFKQDGSKPSYTAPEGD